MLYLSPNHGYKSLVPHYIVFSCFSLSLHIFNIGYRKFIRERVLYYLLFSVIYIYLPRPQCLTRKPVLYMLLMIKMSCRSRMSLLKFSTQNLLSCYINASILLLRNRTYEPLVVSGVAKNLCKWPSVLSRSKQPRRPVCNYTLNNYDRVLIIHILYLYPVYNNRLASSLLMYVRK